MKAELRAIGLIGRWTLQEAARQRAFGLLLGLALALVIGARWLREFNFGTAELIFIADCGFGAMGLFGAALGIIVPTQLFLGEIEQGIASVLLAKPVSRFAFVLGKLLGIAGLLAMYCAGLGVLLAAVVAWRQHELAVQLGVGGAGSSVSYAALAVTSFLLWLKLTVLAALVLLVATFARGALFVATAGCAIFVMGQLQPIARGIYARDASWLGWLAQSGLAVLPNFQAFAVASPTEWVSGFGSRVLAVTAYGLGYAALAGGLAAFSFRHREL